MQLIDAIKRDKENDIYSRIMNDTYPIYIWGSGDVAFNISVNLRRRGLGCAGFIVDVSARTNGAIGGHIYNFESPELPDKYSIIVGHSRYEKTKFIKERYSSIQNVYLICNVQFASEEHNYWESHYEDAQKAHEALADDRSRDIYVAYINAMLNDDYSYLEPFVEEGSNYFKNSVFMVGKDEKYVDVGAFIGDTVEIFLDCCEAKYSKIYTFEPDEDNIRCMKEYFASRKLHDITYEAKGISNFIGTSGFLDLGGQESMMVDGDGRTSIAVDTLDNYFKNISITFLKLNVPDNEKVLLGGLDVIKRDKPNIAIAIGVDEALLVKMPLFFKTHLPTYNVYLRQPAGMPARLLLLAKAKQ